MPTITLLKIHAEPPPLRVDRDGTLRVGATRVTLDAILDHFRQGASPEEIARRILILTPADVHTALGYYLRHQAEVDAYLAERARRAGPVPDAVTDRPPPVPATREQPEAKPEQSEEASPRAAPHAPTTDWRLWAEITVAVIVVAAGISWMADPSGNSLPGFLAYLIRFPVTEFLRCFHANDAGGAIYYAALIVFLEILPAVTLGWVLQAFVVMGVGAYRKRKR